MKSTSDAGTASSKLRVSAVIPAYNREQTVVRAIESVLSQSEPPDQVIVVDDGSTDGTLASVEAFGSSVHAVTQENAGAAAARNRGVQEATGTWIAFLDSDDYWYPDHLARTNAAIHATDGRADVYFSNLRRPPDEGSALQWELSGYECDGEFEMRDDGRAWATSPRQPLMLQSSVVQRAAFLEVGGIWEALRAREDTHLFFKLLVGRPACAVNYCATEMTSDDSTGERLSTKFQQSGVHLEQTVMVYHDLLRNCALTPLERRDIASRLAAGHLGLGKRALAGKRPLQTLSHLARAFAANPSRFFAAVGRRIGLSSAEATESPSDPSKTKVS